MSERLQHRGIRNNVSQVRRSVGFLFPPNRTISLHLEQIFFEQSFAICDECEEIFASTMFCEMMKSERIRNMFIESFFEDLNYQMWFYENDFVQAYIWGYFDHLAL